MDSSTARKGDADLSKDQDDQSSPSSGSGVWKSSPERLSPVKLTTRSKKKVKRHSSPPSDPAKMSSPEKLTTRSKKKLKIVTELEDPDAMRSHVLEIAGGEDIIEAVAAFGRRCQRRVCVLSGNGVVANPTLRQPGEPRSTVALNGRFEILSMSGAFVPASKERDSRPMNSSWLTVFVAGGQGQVVGGGVVGALRASGPVMVFAAILSTASAGEHIALGDDEQGEGSASGQLPSPQTDTPDKGTGDEEDQMVHLVKPPVGITDQSRMEPLSCTTQEVKMGTAIFQHTREDKSCPVQEPQRADSSEPLEKNAGEQSDGTGKNLQSDKQCATQDKRLLLQKTLSVVQDFIKRAEGCVHDRVSDMCLQDAKDAAHDAEDLLDEFKYFELQEKIEGSTIPSRFLELYDKEIARIQGSLELRVFQMRLLDLDDAQQQCIINEPISSEDDLFLEGQTIFGRQKELSEFIQLLGLQENNPTDKQVPDPEVATVPDSKQAKLENVSVLPIVGGVGVGKTALAHLIFNEKRVQGHFDLLIWMCVSDGFDEKKLIKRLAWSVAESDMKTDDLSCLQRILTNGIIHRSRRLFLVLDDAQDDVCQENCHGWKNFLAPLKCARPGSMVLVTTRSRRVAELVGTLKPMVLEGLPKETLCEFFMMLTLGSHHSVSNPVLKHIGESIVARLNGSPLCAKLLGRQLRLKLDVGYWKIILGSELWGLPRREEISLFAAFELSYQSLPFHLKCCFSFCSMYPRGYAFDADTLVDSWVALGFVVPPAGNMLAVDIGHVYFQQLVSRSFFERAPAYSRSRSRSTYIIHGLLYDLAQYITRNECFVIKGRGDLSKIPPKVRHVSILGNGDLSSSDIECLLTYKTLRSIVCIGVDGDIITNSILGTWFDHLTSLRMLRFISCRLKELHGNVSKLILLRYLDISACDFHELPDSLWRLHNLEILDAQNCTLDVVPKDIVRLVNLQRLRLKNDLISQLGCVPEVGKLTLLQNMPYYAVDDKPGRRIQELKNMNHLHGELEIDGLRNVMSQEEAAGAELAKKIYLDTLVLKWHESIRPQKHNSTKEMEVLEALRPSSNIKHLKVKFYMGDGLSPRWLRHDELSSLASLSINSCPNIATLFLIEPSETGSSRSSSVSFQSLTKISITWCRSLASLDNFLRPECLPMIKVIRISNCEELVSLPTYNLVHFVHLEDLEVSHCWSLNWEPRLALPPTLKSLKLEACGEFSDSTLSCLHNLAALTTLNLQFCPRIESISAQIWNGLRSIESLKIVCCQGLVTVGGSGSITGIKNVDIRHCSKLKELEQPFRSGQADS
uniref:PPC domain-containing protein n=1 Tax=Oryza punctata TaxID=4537 RepID=A0A0E0M0F5_ORYPU